MTTLILHGGGGPATVAPLVAHFDGLAPTHPGWNGEPLGDITTVEGIAAHYVRMLEEQNLSDVLVIGSSLGGWIGAEVVLAASDRVSGYVSIDGAGILVEEHPMRDFFSLTPREVAEYSWHDSEKFFVDPSMFPPERIAAQRANMTSMKLLAGDPYMYEPTLRARLAGLTVPSLVVWGEADQIFTPDYGRAFAAAIPGAQFELIAEAGHLPHLEQPGATLAAIDRWLATLAG